jgi:hypothetical protein
MGMKHKEEYEMYKTCSGWREDELEDANWTIHLMFKDVKGEATLLEQVVIEIDYLLGYNDVDYIPKDEIFAKAQKIINLIKPV